MCFLGFYLVKCILLLLGIIPLAYRDDPLNHPAQLTTAYAVYKMNNDVKATKMKEISIGKFLVFQKTLLRKKEKWIVEKF